MMIEDEIFPVFKKSGQECVSVNVSEEEYREHLKKEMGQTLTPANLSRYIEHNIELVKRQHQESGRSLSSMLNTK
jgi:predicted house-cleaning noncanonical NTP pyrophosphatase (MazG superfamily)